MRNMKLCLMLWVGVILTACGNENEVEIRFKVIDEAGKPIEGARVTLAIDPPAGELPYSKLTDRSGEVDVTGPKMMILKSASQKEGYYRSYNIKIPLGRFWKVPFDKSEPIEIVMKEVRNPVAMYARARTPEKEGAIKIPKRDIEYGYDLQIGDWVAPDGNGKVSDLIFLSTGKRVNRKEYDTTVSIKFSNEGDGLIMFEDEKFEGSQLISGYLAPEQGYRNKFVYEIKREKGGAHTTTKNPKANYYFRVRTKLDKDGNVESAHYGKIYGEFMSITHYFNPTPNDRNVEFDPGKNLSEGVKAVNRVKAP